MLVTAASRAVKPRLDRQLVAAMALFAGGL